MNRIKTVLYEFSVKTGFYKVVGVTDEFRKKWKVVPSISRKNWVSFSKLIQEYFPNEKVLIKQSRNRKKK